MMIEQINENDKKGIVTDDAMEETAILLQSADNVNKNKDESSQKITRKCISCDLTKLLLLR